MKIILAHNRYRQVGGEDIAVNNQMRLLSARSADVSFHIADNSDFQPGSLLRSAWNRRTFLEFKDRLKTERPDVVDVQNFWYRLSPSIHGACRAVGVPSIQTLHNYRLLCLEGNLHRKGKVCEDCLGKPVWRGVWHGCYRNSAAASLLPAWMVERNRLRKTWERDVTLFVALTEFSREKFIQGGLPRDRIVVRPNFVEDPGAGQPGGEGAFFAGRLSPEKGVITLLKAWRELSGVRLSLAGDGPLRRAVAESIRQEGISSVELLGHIPPEQCLARMKESAFIILPSLCYEQFPMTIAEAFSCGRPVIASRLGAMAEIVADGKTGLLFEPGNPEDLARKVKWMLDNPSACHEMGLAAREEYEKKYTPEINYRMLMDIYQQAIDSHNRQ